jgi:16S rRNA (guanine527-N7)-methyltransferase
MIVSANTSVGHPPAISTPPTEGRLVLAATGLGNRDIARVAIRAAFLGANPRVLIAVRVVATVVARLTAGRRIHAPFAAVLFPAPVAAVGPLGDGAVEFVHAALQSMQKCAAGARQDDQDCQQTTKQSITHNWLSKSRCKRTLLARRKARSATFIGQQRRRNRENRHNPQGLTRGASNVIIRSSGISPCSCHLQVQASAAVRQRLTAVNDDQAGENDSLSAALERHKIELPPEQVAMLEKYARLLWDWNEKINVTRHTTFEKFVTRDMVDSIWLEKFLDAGERVLDLGTGGGVPGIVLAIIRPDLEISLSESVAKKARLVEDIVKQLELPIRVHHAAGQDVLKNARFDTIVARAVAPLSKILTWVEPAWDQFNQLLLVKGPAWVEERTEARQKGLFNELSLRKLASYPLPETTSESVILSIRPKDSETV